MEQKKYLSLPKKLAYGSGDLGSNFFYMMLTSFALIYMTDAVGLDAGIVGTLIMVSKLLDGITDVFFGSLIDKTHSKMGKARPWMFYSGFPLAISLVLNFAVPASMGTVGQYIWFFVCYTCGNALFYTANNISYATMSALITKNDAERVSLGSFRYVFAIVGSMIVMGVTVAGVSAMGGGMAGWRTMAMVYAVVFLIFNSLASLCCKEVAEEESIKSETFREESFFVLLKSILANKYYLLLLGIYLAFYITGSLGSSIGIYYYQYILGNPALMGITSMSAFVMIIGLALNPAMVKKFGMYKVNLGTYIATTMVSVVSAYFTYTANFSGMLVTAFVRCVTSAFLVGSLNAIVAEVAKNNFLKTGLHTEGMMFSCSSIGMKVGGGLGAGISGWVLAAAGYVGSAEVQTPAVINAIKFLMAGAPLFLTILITVFLYLMKVDVENAVLERKHDEN